MQTWEDGMQTREEGDALGNRVADSGQRSGLGAKEQTWGKGAD